MSDTITKEETALSDEEAPEAVGDTTKQEEEVAADGAGGDSGGKKPFIVYYNALSRVVMAGFLIAAGLFAIPDFWLKTPSKDFQYCAIFFIIGTFLFLICTLIDFKSSFGDGFTAVMNSSLFVVGAAALEAGSIAFYPGVMDNVTCNGVKPCALGQYLYTAGTLVICFALLWNIARLLRSGNVIPYPFIIALFSALVGAINFNYGANFLMPQYQTTYDQVKKGGVFFVVGGCCFMIHALAVCKAYLF
mmetsp:Transcript_15040/g.21370  ORF Transcript_15040/g.21370 Transcript_15040/m.21370 type:complete len:247 (-) Transcript_15040:8-748(-)